MPTLESLGRRLEVGEELKSVVSTMKGLAAASIHDFERALAALREYTIGIEQGLQILFSSHPESVPAATEPGGPVAAIVVGTDQGLCGPLNRELAIHVSEWFAARDAADRRLVAVLGARMIPELVERGHEPAERVALPGSVEAIGSCVDELVERIEGWRKDRGVERVVVFFQHPVRRTLHAPRLFQVLPPDTHRLRSIAARPWPTRMLPTHPHSRGELLAGLLREDLFIALYRAIAEAKTAEHAARLAAMQAAEQNIEDRLERLRTDYHQLRQAEITAQLLDIVSGFEVLADW